MLGLSKERIQNSESSLALKNSFMFNFKTRWRVLVNSACGIQKFWNTNKILEIISKSGSGVTYSLISNKYCHIHNYVC